MTQLQPHIRLSRQMTHAHYALLPGNPQRVEHVARFLDQVEDFGQNREYRALRGWFRGVEVLVISTGMGGPSTAIAAEELHQIRRRLPGTHWQLWCDANRNEAGRFSDSQRGGAR